jgi:mannose-1-phosphate guanylyltransferase
MKALILSAGLGTRLRPLTEHLPKSLLPILGKPLLELIISYLKGSGVEEMAINTHHLSGDIQAYLKSHPLLGSKIYHSQEPEILGTGGAIGKLKSFFKNEDFFILYNGDIFTDLDLHPALKQHEEERPLITMILHDYPPLNNVIINQDDEIIDLRGILKTSPESPNRCLAYTGISIVSGEIFKYYPSQKFSDLIEILLGIILNKKEKVKGFVEHNYYWHDIGTIEDYYKVHREIILEKKAKLKYLPSFSGTTYLGEATVIEEGVSLQGFCSIGKNCLIKKGAYLENCIIWDNTTIEEKERLKDCIKSRELIYHVKP